MSAPCSVCKSPPVLPCERCGSALDHRHLAELNRDGQMLSQVPLCRVCCDTVRIAGTPLSDLLVAVDGSLT